MQRIIIVSLFLAFFAVPIIGQAAAPTIEFLIRAPTIEEFRKKALPQLVSAMGSIDIPPIEQDNLKVTNIVQSNMQLDTANMKINFEAPNFIRLSVNLGMDLRADYVAGWSLIKTKGSVNAKLKNTNLNARLELFLNTNTNKFNVRFSEVDMKVGELDIQLTGDFLAKIANFLKGLFSGLIKSEVQKKTASTLYGVVTDQLNEYLIEAPTVIPLANTPFSVDYQPIASPAITPDEVVVSLNAYLYEENKGKARPPISPPAPLPTIPKDAENIYLTVSEYIFDSIAFSVFDSGFLKLNLTNAQIPKEVPIKLTTKLFEGLFEGLEKIYPEEKNMSLTCYPYAKPNIDLNDKNLTAEVYGACDFLVDQTVKLASLEVNVFTSLNLFIEENSIKGKFIGGGCRSVKVISSQLKADEEGLKGMLDFGFKLGLPVVGKMFLTKGITIPSIPGVEITDTQLAFQKGAIVVQTTPDFTRMDEKTKQILVEMTKKSIAQFIKDLYKRMFAK